jgi:hypothetical protein
MKRENIDPFRGFKDAILTMADGNPGAVSVLGYCLDRQGRAEFMMETLIHLDDMNIRGSQIWIAFKDYCAHGQDRIAHTEENLDRFINAVKMRDSNMVDMVNQASLRGETGTQHKAVIHGASMRSLQGRLMLSDEDKYLLEKEIPLPELPEEEK